MNSILEDLFRGAGTKELSDEFWEELKRSDNNYNKVFEALDDEHRLLFNEFWILYGNMEAESARANFAAGFKIGLALGKEVFGE